MSLPASSTPPQHPPQGLTLLVMAAGLGSRYGGLKQMDAVGPHGETMLDYSVFDALRAGFQRVVFVLRAEFSEVFQRQIGARYAGHIEVAYTCQDLYDVPGGFVVPPDRTKPWGTLHAVLAARGLLDGPFVAINADDFYGQEAFRTLAHFFVNPVATSPGVDHYSMVGYALASTLSSHGGVNRGICETADGYLVSIEEHKAIAADAASKGLCHGMNLAGERVPLAADAVCSMNIWGFTPAILAQMGSYFAAFLQDRGANPSAECYIPDVVDHLIHTGQADCRILPTHSPWFGMTYPQDKALCVQNIQALIASGNYPAQLWRP